MNSQDDPSQDSMNTKGNPAGELDTAGRALADALRISFALLKLSMLVLAILFAFSGTRNVEEGRVALRLFLGAVLGDSGGEVLPPGGPYLAFPAPIGRFIEIDTTLQQIAIDNTYWYEERARLDPKAARAAAAKRPLVPGRDGFLITADKNIVHGKWTVSFRVAPGPSALDFVYNVSASDEIEEMRTAAAVLVRSVAERAIVHEIATTPADDFIRSRVDRTRIRQEMQKQLDKVRAGILIVEVSLEKPTPPPAVHAAFDAVSEAENLRISNVVEAERKRESVLLSVAGSQFEGILQAISELEKVRSLQSDPETLLKAEKALEALLTGPNAQGEVARIIRAAEVYRTSAPLQAKGRAEEFERLLPKYLENPEVFRQRRLEDIRGRVLMGKKRFVPGGSILRIEAKDKGLRSGKTPSLDGGRD